ncbi:hypothetical protein AB0P21_35800 [Kribbella sp. NPDC056861]
MLIEACELEVAYDRLELPIKLAHTSSTRQTSIASLATLSTGLEPLSQT